MASKTTTDTRKRSGSARPRRPARDGRQWWAVAGAAALVAAAGIAWTAAGNRDDRPAAGDSVEQFTHAHGLAVPAWAPQTVYLSTHEGLIRIEGSGWSYASGQHHDFMGFAAHPTEPDLLYTSGHPAAGSGIANPVGFMVSTNGGGSWQVRALEGQADFHAMAVGAGGSVIYGWSVTGQVGLFRSTDQGSTWAGVDAPALQEARGPLALAVHPDDPDLLWAATQFGLLHSPDGGSSWDIVLPGAPVTAVAINPAEPDRMLAYAAPPGDGLLESHDRGQTWTPTGWRLETSDDAVSQLAIHPEDPQVAYAATFGMDLLRSADSGRSWRTLARAGTPNR